MKTSISRSTRPLTFNPFVRTEFAVARLQFDARAVPTEEKSFSIVTYSQNEGQRGLWDHVVRKSTRFLSSRRFNQFLQHERRL